MVGTNQRLVALYDCLLTIVANSAYPPLLSPAQDLLLLFALLRITFVCVSYFSAPPPRPGCCGTLSKLALLAAAGE